VFLKKHIHIYILLQALMKSPRPTSLNTTESVVSALEATPLTTEAVAVDMSHLFHSNHPILPLYVYKYIQICTYVYKCVNIYNYVYIYAFISVCIYIYIQSSNISINTLLLPLEASISDPPSLALQSPAMHDFNCTYIFVYAYM
jgi:hypothetical protein